MCLAPTIRVVQLTIIIVITIIIIIINQRVIRDTQ